MESITIQQTADYDKFEAITGNRNVSEAKIKKMSDDVASGFNMLPYCPVIVSEMGGGGKFGIIDGQHRFEVSRQTANPVYYVVCNTLSLAQIARLNSRSDKWKPADFLNCYIRLGVPDYVELKRVMETYKVSIRIAADLLMFNKAKAGSGDVLQTGEFKCLYVEETETLLQLATTLFSQYKFTMDRYLLQALQTLKEKGICDFDRLKEKIDMAPMIMAKQPDHKQYLNNIETVYNYRDSIRKTIF